VYPSVHTQSGVYDVVESDFPFNLIREPGIVKLRWDVNKNWMDLDEVPGAV
jgi:hypothetical protein